MSDRHVLIVGASSCMGCEIIRAMADDNTVFLAHYRSRKERLDALQAEVLGQIVPMQADLASEEGVDTLLEAVASHCDFPSKIVFIAAPEFVLSRFKDLTPDDFRRQIDVQLLAAVKVLGRLLPLMAQSREGKVVFVLSSYTLGKPPASMAHYITAKYALLGLMKSLASEYAGKQVCINAVSPSMIETSFLAQIPEKIVEFTAQQHPLKRNGRAEDVAPVVKFLLSKEADFLVGVNIPVTGGA